MATLFIDGKVIPRDEVLDATGCPRCGAGRSEPCFLARERANGQRHREQAHRERWVEYAEASEQAGQHIYWTP